MEAKFQELIRQLKNNRSFFLSECGPANDSDATESLSSWSLYMVKGSRPTYEMIRVMKTNEALLAGRAKAVGLQHPDRSPVCWTDGCYGHVGKTQGSRSPNLESNYKQISATKSHHRGWFDPQKLNYTQVQYLIFIQVSKRSAYSFLPVGRVVPQISKNGVVYHFFIYQVLESRVGQLVHVLFFHIEMDVKH